MVRALQPDRIDTDFCVQKLRFFKRWTDEWCWYELQAVNFATSWNSFDWLSLLDRGLGGRCPEGAWRFSASYEVTGLLWKASDNHDTSGSHLGPWRGSFVKCFNAELCSTSRCILSEYPCQCRTLSTPHARHASCLVTLPLPLPTNHLSSHRLYLPIAVMSSQLDVTLAHAYDALRIGRYPSFRATAKAYSLTKSTLRRRY